jgi:hypothetical protein
MTNQKNSIRPSHIHKKAEWSYGHKTTWLIELSTSWAMDRSLNDSQKKSREIFSSSILSGILDKIGIVCWTGGEECIKVKKKNFDDVRLIFSPTHVIPCYLFLYGFRIGLGEQIE